MKSILYGKKITRKYCLVTKRDNETERLLEKPYIKKDTEVEYDILKLETGEDFVIDGEIRHNRNMGLFGLGVCPRMNISETEEVNIEKVIYRADLNADLVYTDKVINEIDIYKEETEAELEKIVAEYNKMMIEEDTELLRYCKVHNLNPEATDYNELCMIVKPSQISGSCVAQGFSCMSSDILDALTSHNYFSR